MSTKENIEYIKDELSSEEKFLEGFVRIERFYKKYKALIITILVAVIVMVTWNIILGYLDNKTKIEANNAFNKFIADTSDEESLNLLKTKNQNLYEIAKAIKARKNGEIVEINVEYLKELSLYEKAIKDSDIKALSSLTLNDKFLLKENAIFNKALLEAKEGKYAAAKETLSQIPQNSKINNMVVLLKHFLASK